MKILIALFIMASLAFAQNRANVPWWNSPVATDIVTPDQEKKIRQIVRNYRDRLYDTRNNAAKAEAALDDIMNDTDVNPEAAKKVIERVANARGAAAQVFLEMSVQLRAVLTADQWRQLVQRWDEVRGKSSPDTLPRTK